MFRGLLIGMLVSFSLVLHAEVRISNLATNGTASASSSRVDAPPFLLNDGNRDGHFWNGQSTWHSLTPDTSAWIEIDLGASYYLDRVMAWPRSKFG